MYKEITTVKQLNELDLSEIKRGYQSAWKGYVLNGEENVSFTHGWHNGMADVTGEPNEAQRCLARDVQRAKREGKL
ncbi:hypothetical protein G646_gp121 [Serratia phage phiMAM1]|uniref:Uncharacterized protein n=2 Tax=Miltonvirus MAM1 TaxID=2169689 RepID=K7YGY3_9CAUD|nr:hypothetical protein G646_gp121 [Serratia phage phiMAM1]AFX93589.1 hypothetical protein MAM_121 [Serratia phage phiMAM1]ASZ78898.1 hypothetical protein 2050H1_132 [Serratia phage 2050H1]